MNDTKEYITLDALKDIVRHVEENVPDRRLRIRRCISVTTFTPSIAIIIPYELNHSLYAGFEKVTG